LSGELWVLQQGRQAEGEALAVETEGQARLRFLRVRLHRARRAHCQLRQTVCGNLVRQRRRG